MGKPNRISEASADGQPIAADDQQQAAAYIADMALGLRGLAHKADLTFLTYLIDMVLQEAIERGERRQKFRDPAP